MKLMKLWAILLSFAFMQAQAMEIDAGSDATKRFEALLQITFNDLCFVGTPPLAPTRNQQSKPNVLQAYFEQKRFAENARATKNSSAQAADFALKKIKLKMQAESLVYAPSQSRSSSRAHSRAINVAPKRSAGKIAKKRKTSNRKKPFQPSRDSFPCSQCEVKPFASQEDLNMHGMVAHSSIIDLD